MFSRTRVNPVYLRHCVTVNSVTHSVLPQPLDIVQVTNSECIVKIETKIPTRILFCMPKYQPNILFIYLFIYLQSTLVISNSKGLSKILRDIRTSTYQICRIEKKIIRTTTFNKYIYVIGLLKLEIY